MGNCHFKTDFDAENITGKFIYKFHSFGLTGVAFISNSGHNFTFGPFSKFENLWICKFEIHFKKEWII